MGSNQIACSVDIPIASLHFVTGKLLPDVVDDRLPDKLDRNLKHTTGELGTIGLRKCTRHRSKLKSKEGFRASRRVGWDNKLVQLKFHGC